MTWVEKFRIPFATLTKKSAVVSIYERDYTGTLQVLTAGDTPFETSEDSDEDVFKPVRSQTGTLRISQHYGDESEKDLIEKIMPTTNTSNLIRLTVDDVVQWQGFLQANMFTQSWNDVTKIIEIPTISILGALEYINIPEQVAGIYKPFAWYLYNGLQELGDSYFFTEIHLIDDAATINVSWFCQRVSSMLFFEQEQVQNVGTTITVLQGKNYREVLEQTLQLFGLTIREQATKLYIEHLNTAETNDGNYRLTDYTLTWEQFAQLANDETPTGTITQRPLRTIGLTTAVDWKGDSNDATYIQGAKIARVVVDLYNADTPIINLPVAEETADAPDEVDIAGGGMLYIQTQANTGAQFFYRKYVKTDETALGQAIVQFAGTVSSPDEFLNHTIAKAPNEIFYTDGANSALMAGAVPVRWFFHEPNSTNIIQLRNGLLCQQYTFWNNPAASYIQPSIAVNAYSIYTIISAQQYMLIGGFLNLKITSQAFFMRDGGAVFGVSRFFPRRHFLYVCVSYGTGNNLHWWNEETKEWTNEFSYIRLHFSDQGNMDSNKTDDMNVKETGGFFIPVPVGGINGNIQVRILSAIGSDNNETYYYYKGTIISELSLKHIPTETVTSSSRSQNVYRQEIINAGFAGSQEINLDIGTMNNNLQSITFLRDKLLTEYVEKLRYNVGDSVLWQRPEEVLLARLASHYKEIRRVYTGEVRVTNDVNIPSKLWKYQGRYFMAINHQQDWLMERQTVKWLEVFYE